MPTSKSVHLGESRLGVASYLKRLPINPSFGCRTNELVDDGVTQPAQMAQRYQNSCQVRGRNIANAIPHSGIHSQRPTIHTPRASGRPTFVDISRIHVLIHSAGQRPSWQASGIPMMSSRCRAVTREPFLSCTNS